MPPPTKLIRIERTQNIDSVADLYHELKKHAPRCSIQVPNDLDDYRMGGKGEFIQFLLSWATDCPDQALTTYIQNANLEQPAAKQLSNLFDQEHGFIIGLRSRKFGVEAARMFVDVKNTSVPTEIVDRCLAGSRIFSSKNPMLRGLRGFVAVDQIMNDSKDHKDPFTQVYLRRTEGILPMKTAFSDLLRELLRRARNQRSKDLLPDALTLERFVERVSRFTYEVFENADRWGTNPYGNSVRGIIAQLHVKETEHFKPLNQQVGTGNPLASYLSNFVGTDGFETTPFFEVTIFDNGPTLAKHYLGRAPKSLTEELKATRKCLLLARGRSPSPNEGRGLYDTMKLLNECGGFLRYRANRLSVYRDFVTDPLATEELSRLETLPVSEAETPMMKLFSLRDWGSRKITPEEHPKAVGAMFTIIVPVKNLSDEIGLQL